MPILDQIADGRTDLVFDYLAQGNAATAAAIATLKAPPRTHRVRGSQRENLLRNPPHSVYPRNTSGADGFPRLASNGGVTAPGDDKFP